MSQTKIANRISIGDKHDFSIEWFMTHTPYPIYEIERVGERYRITGKEREEVDGRKEEETRPTGEKVEPESKTGNAGTGKPKFKPGGKRGRSKKAGK